MNSSTKMLFNCIPRFQQLFGGRHPHKFSGAHYDDEDDHMIDVGHHEVIIDKLVSSQEDGDDGE